MKEKERADFTRRTFLSSFPAFLVGGGLLSKPFYTLRSIQTKSTLKEELTPDELKRVEQSAMAKDLPNYFGKGYSCAESLLMVSLRFLKMPEELVWVAAGFGGGMSHKDLCGFLTSGIMAIGLSSGKLNEERKGAKDNCSIRVKEYWKWWQTMAPLHCAEIRTEGTSSAVCRRLGQIAAAKIEELIKTGKA